MEFGVLVLVEGIRTESPDKKNIRSNARTDNKLNPHMAPGVIELRPHCWEASAVPTAPYLLFLKINVLL